ncbi:FMN-binding negative transcriptional regulator [Roseovarius sp. 2305UL8-3]|uniref:FMN-binding negative transcriptional regulator n=1 Tax=Roseovarius conchicola TaxID=3121636 RepID=UPI0035295D13
MHPNQIFRKTPEARNIAFAREIGFGMLAISTPGAPLISHIPFLLSEDGRLAEFHLVRSNPIARAMKDGAVAARIAVQGPHSYISPDWYGIDDQVPTWNYVAVHLTGDITLAPEEGLLNLLDRQSEGLEARLAPKQPWVTDKVSDGVMERMMRQIVPCRMEVTQIDGTWKFSQNKIDSARHLAADHVDGYGMGSEVRLLAAMMRADPET